MGAAGRDPEFWVERSARVLRFDQLSAAIIGDERFGPYLLVIVVTFLERPLPSVINAVVRTANVLPWRWPTVLWWLVPSILLLAVVSLRTLRDRYDRAVRAAGKSGADPQGIDGGLSPRLQYGMLFLGLVIYATWLWTATTWIFEVRPVFNTIRWFFLVPVFYVPIATDLAASYCQIQLLLPIQIRNRNVALDFSDPSRLGGMYPVGRAMQLAALAIFTALTLYTGYWFLGFTIAPNIITDTDRVFVSGIFGVVWLLSTASLVVGLYLVHEYMKSRRAAELDSVISRTRAIGDDDEVLPYTSPRDESERQLYLEEYVRLDLVERTRTVPFNVAITWELIAGALLPVAFQILTFVI